MKDATSPPMRSKVAAMPVPVPRTGAGNDSGVNANMIAYSIDIKVSHGKFDERTVPFVGVFNLPKLPKIAVAH